MPSPPTHIRSHDAAELIRRILPTLYAVDQHQPRATADAHYHPEATFQDPLVTVRGLKGLRRLIYVNRTFLRDCRIVFGDVAETIRPDGSHVVLADVTCTLVFKNFLPLRPWQMLVGDSFTYQSVHKVVLDENLKVTSHEEQYSLRSILDSAPVGRTLYALFRRVSGGCASDLGYMLNEYIAGDRSLGRGAR
ncbi:MAG: nuclear transport factor 2 family protein [Myxococcaceae bacterium]|nr:MAG: nuclear transport factor 2 family protein [Myxococcaceae bacterium]